MMTKKSSEVSESVDKLTLELRRGTLVMGVLSQLAQRQYGYSLLQTLAEKGMEIDQGTLYPLMRRLEKQGLLDSEWLVEGSRPRRYYVLSSHGQQVLEELTSEWTKMVQVMQSLLQGNGDGKNDSN
jgi:DNA-binding PadR family transcriptional regulator